ncbi:MAG: nitrite reductase small subunit NirD [Magnetococcales bacterium]|nr:nitrite reductase small subunit NirD [Magnetococcales bacterium]
MNDTWHYVGLLDEIPSLEGRVVKHDRLGDLALFRTSDDQLYAVEDRCPHRGGPLSAGMVHGRMVSCPLHGWRLDLATGEVQGPDHGCVTRYPVRVEENKIYLCLEPDHA